MGGLGWVMWNIREGFENGTWSEVHLKRQVKCLATGGMRGVGVEQGWRRAVQLSQGKNLSGV